MDDFVWRDAGRTVLFVRGGLASAVEQLADHGFAEFELFTTERALAGAEDLGSAARFVHEVPPGAVPEAAAAALESVGSTRLVALGGGRVIDTAKAVAAVGGAEVAAIPTTLSGAEMTGIHRLPAGAESQATGLVRPSLVLADPDVMTSQPEPRLRASAMNALGHGADSLWTPFANPVSRTCALRGVELIAAALDSGRKERDRADVALGSLLCGYAIDSGLFALHHVICQTLVRSLGVPHAETNAAVLPHSVAAMRGRADRELAVLCEAIGAEPTTVSERIRALGGGPRGLGALGADGDHVEEALDGIEDRPELNFTPEPPAREELRRIIEAAW